MSGAEFKNKLKTFGVSIAEIAAKIGATPQSLNSTFNSPDIKSGIIEKVAEAMGVSPAFFYEGGPRVVNEVHHSVVKGNGNQVAAGDNSTVNSNDIVTKLLEELAEQRKQNAELMKALLNK